MHLHLIFLAISYVVTTLAGSGLEGIADGPAATATFMKPVGIATDAAGNVYVADAAAQRIRMISTDGTVETLAGSGTPSYNGMWVDGGYRDGPAATAQFNRPSAVAVDARGVFVADTLNHCIRLIHDGVVSTYAGSPGNFTMNDGPVATASFIRPRGLAFDAQGDLYVLDAATGLRRIHNDVVTTLPITGVSEKYSFLSLAFIGPANAQKIVIGTTNEILVFDRNLKLLRRVQAKHSPEDSAGWILYDLHGNLRQQSLDNASSIGPPFGIAGLPDGSFVYADTFTHSLRTLDSSVFPSPLPDAMDWDGGYRDGSIQSALFNAPMGLATMPDGSIVVADMGNRRIRKLTPTNDPPPPDPPLTRDLTPKEVRDPGEVVAGEDPFPSLGTQYYRIAYLGNSYAFYNTRWPQSVEGQLEASLRTQWQMLGFPREPKLASVAPLRGIDGFSDYIDNVLSAGVVDAVIVQLNYANINESYPVIYQPKSQSVDQVAWEAQWRRPVLTFLRKAQKELAAVGIPMVVVTNPLFTQISPNECQVVGEIDGFQDWMWLENGPPGGNDFDQRLAAVVRESGVPSIDLFSSLLAAEQAANHPSLYGTDDGHYSFYGRKVVAGALEKALIQLHPWSLNTHS